MPPVRATALAVSVAVSVAGWLRAGPAAADDCQLRGQVSDVAHGGVLAGARVTVRDRTGVRATAASDRAGRYAVDVPPGEYDVVFERGAARTTSHVFITETCITTFDGKVDTVGEVIVVQDQKPPRVPARPVNFAPRKAPPYSDEAIERDAWTRAWMLLDVSAEGEVTQFKFLKRPGFDLDAIAVGEIWKLKFDPARDDHGQPIRVWLVWGIEWPSNGWLLLHEFPRTLLPPMVGMPPRPMWAKVPCRGSGPMNLDALRPGYRDCSRPDLSVAAKEAWIPRP